jgi:hypothetical protein
MSYGMSLSDLFRMSAFYTDKIPRGTKSGDLPRGTKPGDLPIAQPVSDPE